MDNALFQDHQKKRQEIESLDNRDIKYAEKFHVMERRIDGLISNEQLQFELKHLASSDN